MSEEYIIVPDWCVLEKKHHVGDGEIYDTVEMSTQWSFKHPRARIKKFNGGMDGCYVKISFSAGSKIDCVQKTFEKRPKIIDRRAFSVREVAKVFVESNNIFPRSRYIEFFPLCYIDDVVKKSKLKSVA